MGAVLFLNVRKAYAEEYSTGDRVKNKQFSILQGTRTENEWNHSFFLPLLMRQMLRPSHDVTFIFTWNKTILWSLKSTSKKNRENVLKHNLFQIRWDYPSVRPILLWWKEASTTWLWLWTQSDWNPVIVGTAIWFCNKLPYLFRYAFWRVGSDSQRRSSKLLFWGVGRSGLPKTLPYSWENHQQIDPRLRQIESPRDSSKLLRLDGILQLSYLIFLFIKSRQIKAPKNSFVPLENNQQFGPRTRLFSTLLRRRTR